MRVVAVNAAFAAALESPEALLDAYHTLTGWSSALVGADIHADVIQTFWCDAAVTRGGVTYRFLDSTGPARALRARVLQAVANLDPDVVHVNGVDAAPLAGHLRRRLPTRTAVVLQDHAGRPARAWSPGGIRQRFAMRGLDGYLFTHVEQAAPWIARGCIAGPSRVHAVLEASTTLRPVARATARAVTGVTGTPALLWVGRLDRNKDPLTVIAGFARALVDVPDATLTLVYGEERLLPQVRRLLAGSPRLRERVRLVGRVPHAEMAAWYSAADVFVLGSAEESCGYALLEASACGVVPVVTDIAPFRAITGNGAVGVLWPVGDSAACAAAMVRAAGARQPLAREAVLARFEHHLSWPRVGQRARRIYETVLERCRASDRTREPA